MAPQLKLTPKPAAKKAELQINSGPLTPDEAIRSGAVSPLMPEEGPLSDGEKEALAATPTSSAPPPSGCSTSKAKPIGRLSASPRSMARGNASLAVISACTLTLAVGSMLGCIHG